MWEPEDQVSFTAHLEAVLMAMLEIGFDDDAALERALRETGMSERQEEPVVMAALRRLGALHIFLGVACAEQSQVNAPALSRGDLASVARTLAWLPQSPGPSTGDRFAWDLFVARLGRAGIEIESLGYMLKTTRDQDEGYPRYHLT